MDMVLVSVLALSGPVLLASLLLLFIASRRAAPLVRARQRAIAALCAQRGLLPGVASGDFAILGSIDPRWFSNRFSSPDHGVAVADFCRPAGNNMQFFSLLAFTVAGLNVLYVAVTPGGLTGITVGGPPALELESTEFEKRVRSRPRTAAAP